MKVLVVGGGGREHSLVWKLAQSPVVEELYCAPGNPGMVGEATLVDIGAEDISGLKAFALEKKIDLTIVGPEVPLTMGITDEFESVGLRVAGPSAAAARLEGSKSFSKEIMTRYGVPTAEYRVFHDLGEARNYVRAANRPLVVKADGLAAGKGVLMCNNSSEASEACDLIMEKRAFGVAGSRIVVEEWLQGEEASYLVFTDGKTIVPMPTSQDHKAVGEGDTGPNTGGMGAYSPAPVVTPSVEKKVMDRVIRPVVEGMAEQGIPFKGILYAGLMIDEVGDPYVLEFNVRFGDPECQPLMVRLGSDLAVIMDLLAQGRLDEAEVRWYSGPSVCVVMASGGYPDSYEKGFEIKGLDEAAGVRNVTVFHAGTTLRDGKLVNNGGRVLGVTAHAPDLTEAIDLAYQACDLITWDKVYYRRDIGHRALARERGEGPQVGIVMGSPNDYKLMESAVKVLAELGVTCEAKVLSAHRTPQAAADYAQTAAARGLKVIIAGAGWAAHLAGAMAAWTTLPVIGVPLDSSPLQGLDALLSTVQMPPGMPVATVAIGSGGAKNAGILAAQILALSNPEVSARLWEQRRDTAQKINQANQELDQQLNPSA